MANISSFIPTGTVTLMFTDIQGSVQLWEQFQEDFMPILERHNEIVRKSTQSAYEVSAAGDSFRFGPGRRYRGPEAPGGEPANRPGNGRAEDHGYGLSPIGEGIAQPEGVPQGPPVGSRESGDESPAGFEATDSGVPASVGATGSDARGRRARGLSADGRHPDV